MKFHLIDKIERLQPGKRIVTIKALSLAEEYLADHFPTFPVLPGVLMLEALTQSAAWLVRIQQDFAKSIIILRKAQNVRYSQFVAPGDILRCEVDALTIGDQAAKFKGVGLVDGATAMTARLELACFNVADRQPALTTADAEIVAELRRGFKLIRGPEALAEAGAS